MAASSAGIAIRGLHAGYGAVRVLEDVSLSVAPGETVALLGSTDPRFSNTNLQHSAVVRTGVECSPCHLKVCPIDHRCMTRMSAEMVIAACERVLAGA